MSQTNSPRTELMATEIERQLRIKCLEIAAQTMPITKNTQDLFDRADLIYKYIFKSS